MGNASAQYHREMELERIRMENSKEASSKEPNQYRETPIEKQAKRPINKKIQEEYSMYEEEEKAVDDDELDDIMEEDHEEESEDSDGNIRGAKGKKKKRDRDETQEE
jgi:hypothetical protein